MASAVFPEPEKRTRSQLALPDDFLLQLSQGSPFKDARRALRHNTSRTEQGNNHEGIVEETNDELLLSPPWSTARTIKRSVSPSPGDEYAFRPKSPSDGREYKRRKVALVLNGQTMRIPPSRPAHTRSIPQPQSIRDLSCAHSGTGTDPPSQGNTELTVKGKAQSVPLFPSRMSSGIMHIDLRNPPAFPRRPRSRSPSKEPELRIIPGPAAIVKLDTIQDEAVNVEQGSGSLPQTITYKDSVSDTPSAANESATGTIMEASLPLPTPSKKRPPPLVLSVVVQPSATPRKEFSLSPLTPMRESTPSSPLTPVSETPLSPDSEENKFVGPGSTTSLLEETPVSPAPSSKPSSGLATITKSMLPRPSSSTNLALSSAQPPKAIPADPAPSIMPDAPVEPTGSDALSQTHVPLIRYILSAAGDVHPIVNADNAASIAADEHSKTSTFSAGPTPANPPIKAAPTTKAQLSKRKPSSIPAPTRITRSVSLKRNQKVSEIPRALPSKTTGKPILAKQKSLTTLVPEVVPSGSLSKIDDDILLDPAPSTSNTPSFSTEPVNAGSPKENGPPVKSRAKTPISSYAKPTISAMNKQVSPKKLSLSKSRNSSSRNKLARSASMLSRSRVSLSRSFTSYSTLQGSSLSTLSSALEKLKQRPPERPNTSLAFNRDDPDSSIELQDASKDDSFIRPSDYDESKTVSSSKEIASSSRPAQRNLFGGPRSSLTGKFAAGFLGSGTRTSGIKLPGQPSKTGSRIFGVGGGLFSGPTRTRTMQKASRKTSLPSVMASPVKGGDAMDISDDNVLQAEDLPLDMSADGMAPDDSKGKSKERIAEFQNFELSLAPQALSKSLDASSTKGVGLMGPSATPKGRKGLRSSSSTYPSTSSGAETSGRVSPTRSSFRLAEKTFDNEASGSTLSTVSTTNQLESLQFLKDCIIFVDVKTDDGDNAGSLFVEMLEGLGARILTRVGQTCTHIVFKNGLMSTFNRYRLLRDPKPLVVGIAWVVECVEQRKHLDEAKFLVDLDGINVSGTNKRRRSMLPKLISHDFEQRSSSGVEGDVSMDGSTSSMTLDELPPLEKARRRIVAR